MNEKISKIQDTFLGVLFLVLLPSVIISFVYLIKYENVIKQLAFTDGFTFLKTIESAINGSAPILMGTLMGIAIVLCIAIWCNLRDHLNRNFLRIGIALVFLVSIFIGSSLNISKEDIVLKYAKKEHSRLLKNSYGFDKSDINNEILYSIHKNDYDKLKKLFTEENVTGLSKNEVFEKIIVVQNINNDNVHKEFNKIYADRFISIKEYSDFKSYVIEELSNNMQNNQNYSNNMKAASLL